MKKRMYKILIGGIVQGVGFRPAVFRTCYELGLLGYVMNTGGGVEIVVNRNDVIDEIKKGFPKISRIDSFEVFEFTTREEFSSFEIRKSKVRKNQDLTIPADLDVCRDCLDEIKKSFRRKNYFFTTCTNCGPRYSVLKNLPYDRENTAMKDFSMCSDCRKEYEDVYDRRYHAQTIACSKCGPALSVWGKKGKIDCDDPLKLARKLLDGNKVVAVKGVGGFQLFCNLKKKTVLGLRKKVFRKDKPFALIAKSLGAVRKYCVVGLREKEKLHSRVKPIMILRKKGDILKYVSSLDTLGVMLGSSALHELLLKKDECLIATSANLPGEPMVIERSEVLFKMADYVLDYDRKIVNRVDDSIFKNEVIIRKSRGMVPDCFYIDSKEKRKILALGAQMSGGFSIYFDGKIVSSPYLGNLESFSSQENFKNEVFKFLDWVGITPEVILIDKNERYFTNRFGKKLSLKWKIPNFGIQHHLSHLYSASLEYKEKGSFSGVVCDGTGLGNDGKVWGGEVFLENKRVGKLEDQLMALGEKAILDTRLMWLGIMGKFLSRDNFDNEVYRMFGRKEGRVRIEQVLSKWNSLETSSAGRVLDAASFLLTGISSCSYEGRPAMELEAFARSFPAKNLKPRISKESNLKVLNTTFIFEYVFKSLKKDDSLYNKKILAATVQKYLARGLFEILESQNIPRMFFSGGVAYNDQIRNFLTSKGVLVNQKFPCGDGGISFGQIGYFLANSGD